MAQRFWRSGPFWFEQDRLERGGVRLPPGKPIKHYAKVLTPILEEERDYLLWAGHDPSSAAGYTQVEIQFVVQNLMASRWGLADEEQVPLDTARVALHDLLEQTEPDVWHVARQTWIVDPDRRQRLKEVMEDHSCLQPLFRTARRKAEKEHRALVKRGEKLTREMSEGTGPPHERLRKTVYEFRQRRLLPDGPPPGPRV